MLYIGASRENGNYINERSSCVKVADYLSRHFNEKVKHSQGV